MFNQQGKIDPTIVTFYDNSKQNNFKSREEGKAVYDNILYIHKVVPFKEKDSIRRPARDKDKQDYPQQYQAYQDREKYEAEGTTIQNWNFPNESQVKMLSSQGIKTVEQVAALGDDSLSRMGHNARTLRDTAKKFIMQGDAADSRKKIADLEAKCDELTEQVANLLKANDTKESEVKKGDTSNSNPKRGKRDGAASSSS